MQGPTMSTDDNVMKRERVMRKSFSLSLFGGVQIRRVLLVERGRKARQEEQSASRRTEAGTEGRREKVPGRIRGFQCRRGSFYPSLRLILPTTIKKRRGRKQRAAPNARGERAFFSHKR